VTDHPTTRVVSSLTSVREGRWDMKLRVKRAFYAAATLALAVVAFGAAVKFR
jgi:hypothetical protein